jgi:hypothetical protein
LIAAVAVVLIGAMWAASSAQRITLSTQGAQVFQNEARAHALAEDGMASAIYMLTTSPRSPCGLQPDSQFVESDFGVQPDLEADCVWLDDRPILLGDAQARLQDERGLFSVRVPMDEFNAFAAPFAAPADRFEPVDALNDYIDRDDVPRLHGAEAGEYRSEHLPEPPNRWPRTPYQAFDVLGWKTLARPEIANALGLGNASGFNLNAVSAYLLAATVYFGGVSAEEVVEKRKPLGYNGDSDLIEKLGRKAQLPPFKFLYVAGDIVRVRVSGKGPTMIEGAVALWPADNERLWSLDYVLTAPNMVHDGKDDFKPELTLSPNGSRRDGQRSGSG